MILKPNQPCVMLSGLDFVGLTSCRHFGYIRKMKHVLILVVKFAVKFAVNRQLLL